LRAFILKVGGRPPLAFEVHAAHEAHALCKETWLREELSSLKSDGLSLLSAKAGITVRPATAEEVNFFRQGAEVAKPSADPVLIYLVKLDDEQSLGEE
jgi:hypothetical protein